MSEPRLPDGKPVSRKATLRDKSQITIPRDIVDAAGLEEGQEIHFVYYAADDIIQMKPMITIPKPKLPEIVEEDDA